MKIWKLLSIVAMSMLLAVMLAACGGGSSADSATSTPTTAAPTSAPTTAAPTSAPATGGCTTGASCQKAVVSATPNQVKPGGKVTITVKGWIANAKAQVQAAVQGGMSDVVTATSDAQGNLTATITILPDASTTVPPDIHVVQQDDNADHSKDLTVSGKLTIIQ